MTALTLRDVCGDAWPLVDEALSDQAIASIDAYLACEEPDQLALRFGVADALCWLAHDWGGSQSCPLRAAAHAFDFSPGVRASGPEEGLAQSIYDVVDAELRQ